MIFVGANGGECILKPVGKYAQLNDPLSHMER